MGHFSKRARSGAPTCSFVPAFKGEARAMLVPLMWPTRRQELIDLRSAPAPIALKPPELWHRMGPHAFADAVTRAKKRHTCLTSA
jgi:hypothetical protein